MSAWFEAMKKAGPNANDIKDSRAMYRMDLSLYTGSTLWALLESSCNIDVVWAYH